MSVVGRGGFVMSVKGHFIGRGNTISIDRRGSGLRDGSLKDTLCASWFSRAAIAGPSFIGSLATGSIVLRSKIKALWEDTSI